MEFSCVSRENYLHFHKNKLRKKQNYYFENYKNTTFMRFSKIPILTTQRVKYVRVLTSPNIYTIRSSEMFPCMKI